MSLAAGTRLGPYEILAATGAGGTGEVYRARDTRLGRTVAIKVLPGGTGGDADQRARLEREPRAISSLNHPNICALYDVGSEAGVDFLVIEYLEGESLAARLARGPLSAGEILQYCLPIAAALETAHQGGILHRDLKPDMVRISPEGHVKLLDFGLAKVLERPQQEANLPSSPTRLDVRTRDGAMIGTPAYMSHEQVRGLPADERADIWALGYILYEALAGRPPFARATAGDTVAAVLEHEPDWSAIPSSTSRSIVALTKRCLEKDRDRRIAKAIEVRPLLEDELAHLRRRPPRSSFVPIACIAGTIGLTGVLFIDFFPRGEEAPMVPAASPRLEQVSFAKGVEQFPARSPDGGQLAYSADSGGIRKLHLLGLAGGEDQELTSGKHDETMPSWSSDGRRSVFQNIERTRFDVRIVDLSGGPPIWFTNDHAPDVDPVWGPGDRFVYFPPPAAEASMSGEWRSIRTVAPQVGCSN